MSSVCSRSRYHAGDPEGYGLVWLFSEINAPNDLSYRGFVERYQAWRSFPNRLHLRCWDFQEEIYPELDAPDPEDYNV